MNVNDGGPAFPVVQQVNAEKGMWATAPAPHPGMSLRDYFAGQAIHGAADSLCDNLDEPEPDDVVWVHALRHAKAAYLLADAMLAQRQKAEAPS